MRRAAARDLICGGLRLQHGVTRRCQHCMSGRYRWLWPTMTTTCVERHRLWVRPDQSDITARSRDNDSDESLDITLEHLRRQEPPQERSWALQCDSKVFGRDVPRRGPGDGVRRVRRARARSVSERRRWQRVIVAHGITGRVSWRRAQSARLGGSRTSVAGDLGPSARTRGAATHSDSQ